MATLEWDKPPRKTSAKLTKSDGEKMFLKMELRDMNTNNIRRKGDCVYIPTSDKKDFYIGKIVGFRFSGSGEPTGIFWIRWKGQSWGDNQHEIPREKWDSIQKIDCPDHMGGGRAWKTLSTRKNRKSKRGQTRKRV